MRTVGYCGRNIDYRSEVFNEFIHSAVKTDFFKFFHLVFVYNDLILLVKGNKPYHARLVVIALYIRFSKVISYCHYMALELFYYPISDFHFLKATKQRLRCLLPVFDGL